MSERKITVENINVPGQVTQVREDKYLDMKAAILKSLPSDAPGLTQAEIKEAVLPHLSEALFPEGATAGWWAKSVQLDLEAKNVVLRSRTKPLRWYLA